MFFRKFDQIFKKKSIYCDLYYILSYICDLILNLFNMKKKLSSLKARSLQKNTLLTIKGGKKIDPISGVDTLNLTWRSGVVSEDSVTQDV